MNYSYPYPIPGGELTAQQEFTGPYFVVGNECCNGGMTNDSDARTKVMLDYSTELPSGVNVTVVNCTVSPPGMSSIAVTGQVLANNIVTFFVSGGQAGASYSIEALAQLDDGQIWIDHITVAVTSCGESSYTGSSLLYGPGPVVISSTLYYKATAGQIIFPLWVPDLFGQTAVLGGNNVLVHRNGARLILGDSYTIDSANNRIIFIWPLGADESVIFDLVTPAPVTTVNVVQNVFSTEPLTIVTQNVFPPLTYVPTVVMLFVNGRAFFAVGTPPDFAVSDRTIVWMNGIYSVPPGAAVVAAYTHEAYGPPPLPPSGDWWLGLPLTLPPTPGVMWNNGGVLCIS